MMHLKTVQGNIDKKRCMLCGDIKNHVNVRKDPNSNNVWSICHDCEGYTKWSSIQLTHAGWIYMIGAGEYWKIGQTQTSVKKRLSSIQTGNPHELTVHKKWLVDDVSKWEKYAWVKAKEYHYRGEWFKAKPRQLVLAIQSKDS